MSLEKDEKGAQRAEIQGRPLQCLVCGGERFHRRKAQLNTRLLTFLDLDWANPNAHLFVCDRCGHIHWFLPREDEAQL